MVLENVLIKIFKMQLSSFPITTYWRDFFPLYILASFVISYVIYMWNLIKNDTNELIYKAKTDSQISKTNSKGEMWGWGIN